MQNRYRRNQTRKPNGYIGAAGQLLMLLPFYVSRVLFYFQNLSVEIKQKKIFEKVEISKASPLLPNPKNLWESGQFRRSNTKLLLITGIPINFDWGPKIEKFCDVSLMTFFGDIMAMTLLK